MSAERFETVERIFHEAKQLQPSERTGFLDEACSGDQDLRAELESLLAHAGDDSLHIRSAPSGSMPETPGKMIGRYKLLQQIGEGGFGTVYMAEQQEPVRRKVALKIIKPGMDTKQVIARFEAERQALAMMDHVGIAKVLDGGATESGRPYFVMELIKGVPITDYCDANNLTTKERLELFQEVCSAVHHAHQKGVIHRDLKPTNVMVTLHDDRPVPKVIDFGIAKATQQRLSEKTLFTSYGQFIGTPDYMSPEQAALSGLDVDTRTDVYSLGVLLYELLTGTTPFDSSTLQQAAFDEFQRILREVDPPRPSTRISTMAESSADMARHRGAEPAGLAKLVRGDLDWIVMQALEKDRTRRYESASELANDVRRHLADEPVLASPPSAFYRLRKFARRNRVGVAAGAFMTFALLAGVAISTLGFVEARRERRLAVTEAENARLAEGRAREQRQIAETNAIEAATQAQNALLAEERERQQREVAERKGAEAATQAARVSAVFGFLEETIASADPYGGASGLTVVDMLDAAVERLDSGALSHQPLYEARVRTTLGRTYMHLHVDRLEAAETQLVRANEIWLAECPSTNDVRVPQIIHGTVDLAELEEAKGHPSAAEELYREALRLARVRTAAKKIEGDLVPITLTALGRFLVSSYRSEAGSGAAEAEALFREALELANGTGDPDRVNDVAESMRDVARSLTAQGEYEEPEALLLEVLSIQRTFFAGEHAEIATTLFYLGELLEARDDASGAEARYREAIDMRRRTVGEDSKLAVQLIMLAHLLRGQERYEEAEEIFRHLLDGSRESLPEGHPGIATCLNHLAIVLAPMGRYEEAEDALREAVEILRNAWSGGQRTETIETIGNLAGLYYRLERYDEAEPLMVEVCEWFEEYPPQSDYIRSVESEVLARLVHLYETTDRRATAEAWRAKLRVIRQHR